MADYRRLHAAGGPVLVEVQAGGGGTGGGLADLLAAIAGIGATCGDAVGRLPEPAAPGEVAVTFGLRALADGSMAVVGDAAQASFQVRMTWSRATAATDVAGALPRPPTGS